MISPRHLVNTFLRGALVFVFVCMFPLNGSATKCNCSLDAAEPPFLSQGADPNVLLMIDNSASMYDVAYNDPALETYECFDDTFDTVNRYWGYFDPGSWDEEPVPKRIDTWYMYDTSDLRFVPVQGAQPSGTYYTGTDGPGKDFVKVQVTGSDTTGWTVNLFATGQFLNWATVSKFDIQKAILTGGKYNPTDQHWISEGRGCSGYRFAKQVPVSLGGGTYYLSMGIKADEGDETTILEIFKITQNGYQYDACQEAIEEVLFGTGNPQNAVSGCIDPYNESGNPDKQVLIHSTTDCWKYWKEDLNNWPQHTQTLLGKCQDVYLSGKDPKTIVPSDPEYACFGGINEDVSPVKAYGYIGRCWKSSAECTQVACIEKPADDNKTVYHCGATGVEFCPSNRYDKKTGSCSVGWSPYVICEGGADDDGWIDGYTGTGNISDALTKCVFDGMSDYCAAIQMPQVVDASDLEFSTGEVYNLPAILTDAGLVGQLNEPLARWPVRVKKSTAEAPEGVVQEFASRFRLGAMAFNRRGSASECTMSYEDPTANPHLLYACERNNLDGNRDGAMIIHPIGSDLQPDHTKNLVDAINRTKADTWTPLAEAMYTAIGYFTQKKELELNLAQDWSRTDCDPPLTEYCQSNNVVFITDGASTADQASAVQADLDGDGRDKPCGQLYGSTYFDDWAYYGRQGASLYDGSRYKDEFLHPPEPINTFVVYTGKDRSGENDPCTPYGLLKAAVDKGGPNATNPDITDTVFEGDDPDKLDEELRKLFKTILKRASAGSAASVISATRSGEGAVYQAIFWPGIDGANGMPDATWAGEVHALLVDDNGWLYEDTDGDQGLSDADRRVIFFYDEHGMPAETKACYGVIENGTCSGELKSLHEVRYLWSVANWLADIDDTDIVQNRTNTDYISNQRRRYIFTWNDLNNDGRVDAKEIVPFEAKEIGALQVQDRRDVSHDFGADNPYKLSEIINWVRGKDIAGLRSRAVDRPLNFNLTDASQSTITWRLGDIIHSTPTVVGRPSESYHLLYQDASYAEFAAHYKNRRQVVYFGANDGMLHAINGGFYDQMSRKYCLTPDCAENATGPALGAELWAYVPYNLQPQLKCLLEPDYLHRYYVDQKPRIFDVQIFKDDADHPGGWGTILVAGMRLGGNTVSAQGTEEIPDNRKFSSSFIILDVTNPEKPPTLLGELTYDPDTSAHMGYTTATPTVVPMRSGTDTKWYLVLGSGPMWLDENNEWESNKAIEGRSNRPAKIAAFPLDALTKSSPDPFRIADPAKGALPYAGERLWVLSDENSFISDLITVDFNVERDYRGDAVYFGTVEGDWNLGWGGKMYRIATNADKDITEPAGWSVPKLLLNPNRPITAAPSVGWDGYNYWIYFGTGRFFDKKDKSDDSSNAQDYYFGIKEPVNCIKDPPIFTWGPVATEDLLRTDQIQVFKNVNPDLASLGCRDGSSCLPDGVTSLGQLIDHIAGHGCDKGSSTGLAGWYRHFPETERNLGQATLLGGLLTYTTYQPFDDVCLPDGLSFLEAVYYQTGTAWHHEVFRSPYGLSQDTPQEVLPRLELGHGLALTPNLHVGRQDGARAFIQTSTGAIVEIDQELPIDNVKSGRINWRDD